MLIGFVSLDSISSSSAKVMFKVANASKNWVVMAVVLSLLLIDDELV